MSVPGGATAEEVRVRRARPSETPALVALAGEALGWVDGESDRALFEWKHHRNPFGRSPMWLAEVDGVPAGFRTFLRWRWRSPTGRRLRAVRAVDTATLPRFQGRGVFRALTTAAVEELRSDGVDFVFNTPNAQSRPGYLAMGWEELGRVPVGIRPLALRRLPALGRARVAAGRWSLPTGIGEPAAAVLQDRMALAALLGTLPVADGLRTDLTPEVVQWRYAGGPVTYRAITARAGLQDGVVLFRLRRRGAAVEAVVADVLVPAGPSYRRRVGALLGELRRAARGAGAAYLLTTQRARVGPGGSLRVTRVGPVMTWRPLAEPARPAMARWALALGDVELF